jgi:hypothetical protein
MSAASLHQREDYFQNDESNEALNSERIAA